MSDKKIEQPPTFQSNPALLVHGECECGWAAALPEGAHWPLCPICGEQVQPPPASLFPEKREAYVALRMPEQDAAKIVLSTFDRQAAHRIKTRPFKG